MQVVTDQTFEMEVLQSDKPVLVLFWADWCRPCHTMIETLTTVSKLYTQKVKFLKFCVDENEVTPQKYNIRGVPSLLLFENGTEIRKKLGILLVSQLSTFLDIHL